MLPSRGGRKALFLQIGLSLILLSKQVVAQRPYYTSSPPSPNNQYCDDGWDLVTDSGQDPCQAVIEAMTTCAGTYTLPNITTQPFSLFPVPVGNTTNCECNEVAYNLFQACAACQLGADATLSRHQAWFANCPNSNPEPIQPPRFAETTFWATQVYNPIFNVSQALEVARTGQPPPSQSVDSSSGAETASPSALSASSMGKKSNNTGAIIGGVIGGVVLLSLIIVGIIFYMRRKQSRTAPSKEFMQYAPVNQAIIPPQHDEESSSFHNQNLQSSQQLLGNQSQRSSAAIRQDSGVTEEMEALPGFTPGLFKDPIFEKGAALNIASHAGYPTGVAGGASPVTYSPATPSTTYHTNEGQRLIQSRQGSGS